MSSGFSVVKITQTSVRFKIELTGAFNASNYIRAGVCNFYFKNGISASYFVENKAFNRIAWATTAYNDLTVVYLTVTGLQAGTEYRFYGFAQSYSTQYWCLGEEGGYIDVTTKDAPASAGIPEDLICRKRWQSTDAEDDECNFVFEMTLPEDTYQVQIDMAYDSDFQDMLGYRSIYTEEHMTRVSGYTYSYSFNGVPCAATYYVRARCSKQGAPWGAYCSPEKISAPPSNAIFAETLSLTYFTYYDGALRLALKSGAQNYSFTRAVFTIYSGGVPVNLTHTLTGQTLTSYGKASYQLYKSAFTVGKLNGAACEKPKAGSYLGIIRVFYDAGTASLQAVNTDGEEICFMGLIDVEDSAERPDYFDWDSEKVSGGEYNLTADEWIRLTGNINDVLTYKDLDTTEFTVPVKDVTPVSAAIFNEVISALAALGVSAAPAATGEVVYAKLFDTIKNGINSIE